MGIISKEHWDAMIQMQYFQIFYGLLIDLFFALKMKNDYTTVSNPLCKIKERYGCFLYPDCKKCKHNKK